MAPSPAVCRPLAYVTDSLEDAMEESVSGTQFLTTIFAENHKNPSSSSPWVTSIKFRGFWCPLRMHTSMLRTLPTMPGKYRRALCFFNIPSLRKRYTTPLSFLYLQENFCLWYATCTWKRHANVASKALKTEIISLFRNRFLEKMRGTSTVLFLFLVTPLRYPTGLQQPKKTSRAIRAISSFVNDVQETSLQGCSRFFCLEKGFLDVGSFFKRQKKLTLFCLIMENRPKRTFCCKEQTLCQLCNEAHHFWAACLAVWTGKVFFRKLLKI